MHYRSGAGGFYQSTPTSHPFTAPFSAICPIKSCSPPRFLHRRHGWRNPLPQLHPDSTTGVEASRRQGRPLVPASPPAADIIIAPPVVEHHSTHQRRDRRGRFARTSNVRPRRRTTTNRSRRQAAEEPAVPLIPRPEDDEYGVIEILDVMPPVFYTYYAIVCSSFSEFSVDGT